MKLFLFLRRFSRFSEREREREGDNVSREKKKHEFNVVRGSGWNSSNCIEFLSNEDETI
jgi:hypothetical protein